MIKYFGIGAAILVAVLIGAGVSGDEGLIDQCVSKQPRDYSVSQEKSDYYARLACSADVKNGITEF